MAHTNNAIYLEDGETAKITKDSITVYDKNFAETAKETKTIELSKRAASKGYYPHFMLKEIFEEPAVVRETISSVTKDGDVQLENIPFSNEDIKNINRIYIVGCGSAYHVGLIAKYNFEKIAQVPTFAEYAGEFRYEDPVIDENCLVIIMSQSGETADSLAALKQAKEKGAKTISIVNVP